MSHPDQRPPEATRTAEDTPSRARCEAIDLLDRACRVRGLIEFMGGYALLVDACEDGTTIDNLKMAYLGIPLLEASEVVQELIDAVEQTEPDETGGERTAQPGGAR